MNEQSDEFGIDPAYLPPEELWQAFEPLIPDEPPKPQGGRPRKPDRQAFCAIFSV